MRKQYDFSHGRRGPIVAATKGKTRITIRVDDDLLEWFRQQVDDAGGGNYQTMINAALRSYMQAKQEPLEAIVRRVVKDELRKDKSKRSTKSKRAA
ncbi:MAG TPA: BrnA antitoxin family protein [Polyangiaceae bacterium]|nr:BrnA antitoxin family protein [Polyangiaceae bacterium]